MSHLRGIDRAHDIDLGPSGYAPRGHHFEAIGHMPTPTEIRMAAERKAKGIKTRVIPARCLFLMPRSDKPCLRPIGHRWGHRAVEHP